MCKCSLYLELYYVVLDIVLFPHVPPGSYPNNYKQKGTNKCPFPSHSTQPSHQFVQCCSTGT
jgi:hypothetical protein